MTVYSAIDLHSTNSHAGSIRAYLEPKELMIRPPDTPITARARSLNAVVITNSVSEFSRVPESRVETWGCDTISVKG